jgi:hypothetical protein
MSHARRLAALVLVVCAGLVCLRGSAPPAARADLPARLTDAEFWDLTERMSEPGGSFRSDNFLSNERGYQIVIPDLIKTARPHRVYLGVGPEQNFPYIIALEPQMAFIFDIRRGNLHEHLLYKALFEMSKDRADFLSRLWSRARPDGLTTASTAGELMAAYEPVAPTPEAYAANVKAVTDWLTKTHRFKLHDGDLEGIDYVYKEAFYAGGPDLNYSMGGGFGGNRSTYAELQALDDGQGVNRGFLAMEKNWLAIKDLESRNLIVPVVGDFGGPFAIRAVGAYLKAHDALVSAFYLSNVEQYLNQDGKEDQFLCSVAALPLDDTSTFIYTGGGRYGRGFGRGFGGGFGRGGGRGGGLNVTFLRPMLPDAQSCTASTLPAPAAPARLQ